MDYQSRSSELPHQLRDTAHCLNCRYLLRGLPDHVCPECGSKFDPADPLTYFDSQRPNHQLIRYLTRILSPNGPPTIIQTTWFVLLAGCVSWTAVSAQSVFGYWDEIGRLLYIQRWLTVGFGIDLIWRWVVSAKARRSGQPEVVERFRSARGRVCSRIAMTCVLVSGATLVYPWPTYLRFFASRPALEREARACLQGTGDWNGWRKIGLYEVEYLHGMQQGFVFFQTEHDGQDTRYGFAYRPNGPPPWKYRFGAHAIKWRWIAPNWYMEAW